MEETLTQPAYIYADILIALAAADGEVADSERELLDGIFANMQLAPERIQQMWLTPRSLDVVSNLLAGLGDGQFRNCLLKDAYLLAYADEQIHPAEGRFLSRLRELTAIPDQTAERIHQWVQTAIAQKRAADELFGG